MRRTLLIVLILAVSFSLSARQTYNFNSGWLLHVGEEQGARHPGYADAGWKQVTLPYAFNEDEAFAKDIHQLTDTVMWYRKHFRLPADTKDKKVFLEFEGARQAVEVYVNGQLAGCHENGVMAFGLDITSFLKRGRENVIAVRVDNDWDYKETATDAKYQWNNRNFNANYGGLPKNVWLHVCDRLYQTLPLYSNLQTTGTYIYATDIKVKSRTATVHVESEVMNETGRRQHLMLQARVYDRDGRQMATLTSEPQWLSAGAKTVLTAQTELTDLHFWSWGYGYLYTVRTSLVSADSKNDNATDEVVTRTGFRHTRFAEGKFWLNDRVLQLKGYAQRTSNEWPAVGMSVPAWLSDYSNDLMVRANANVVRWMHVTPWKQDVESCDRVGLLQAMPAGDAEKDIEGPQWEQRKQLMRDAIIYNRNNPSVIFYESGNESISREHMFEMMAIRDTFDPYGGRAIGSREMLDIREAEYGGEMLYINKSCHSPFWAMEYCRDEGLRKYWDEYSYPYHKEGVGSTSYRSVNGVQQQVDMTPYNHNQDAFTRENVIRWYDYFRERPGTGRRVSSGGAKIIFSDTNTHSRGEADYRLSGDTDPMRIPKDSYFAHQVMWDGWVDIEHPRVYIVGHWNYTDTVVKPVMVVANTDSVDLWLNGQRLPDCRREYGFLFTTDSVRWQPGRLTAIGYDGGQEVARCELNTAGPAKALRLTKTENPLGWQADGNDLVLVEVEVVDGNGRRCPLANNRVSFTLEGPAEWRGGIAQGPHNCILSRELPVECGVNRVLIRSAKTPGRVELKAQAEGLETATITLQSLPFHVRDGLSDYVPAMLLQGRLDRGETPLSPPYTEKAVDVGIVSATAGYDSEHAVYSFDDNELSEWKNDGQLSTAWITYDMERRTVIDEICMKLTGWRMRSYPLEVYADDQLVWSGETEKSLGYIHLPLKPVMARHITLRLKGSNKEEDSFGGIVEVTEPAAGELDLFKAKNGGDTKNELRIVEIELKQYLHR